MQGRLSGGHVQLYRVSGLVTPMGLPQESWASSVAAEVWLCGLSSRPCGCLRMMSAPSVLGGRVQSGH